MGRRRPRDATPEPVGSSLLHAWPDARLDLHGLSAAEARIAMRNFLMTQARLESGRIVHLVTGKGTGALLAEAEGLLRGELRAWAAEWALDLQGAGYRVRVR